MVNGTEKEPVSRQGEKKRAGGQGTQSHHIPGLFLRNRECREVRRAVGAQANSLNSPNSKDWKKRKEVLNSPKWPTDTIW